MRQGSIAVMELDGISIRAPRVWIAIDPLATTIEAACALSISHAARAGATQDAENRRMRRSGLVGGFSESQRSALNTNGAERLIVSNSE